MASGQQPPEPSAPQPKPAKKRGGCLKIAGVVVGVLIILAIIGAVLGNSGNKQPPNPPVTPASVAQQTTPAAQPTASKTTTPTPTPTETAPPAKPKTYAYAGTGNRIIKIKKPSGVANEPVIATISHHGSSNFDVWTLNTRLKQQDLLVNTIGNYSGTVAIDFEDTTTARVQFEADGTWKMTIKPVTSAPRFSSTIKGKGDDVVHYMGGPKVANITHKGSGNFAVWYYGADGNDLLVNEIGNYKGQSALTAEAYLVITADGAWTINAK